MCGIVGGIGKEHLKDVLIGGLKDLDYRGYDSAGIALVNESKINLYRAVGTISHLEEKLPQEDDYFMGIAHTRWATHGVPSVKNCHPVASYNKKVYLVHNGVIENYLELKSSLLKSGYSFRGDTDSEVVATLIEKYSKSYKNRLKAITKAMNALVGSFALIIIFEDDLNTLYTAKRSSPMILGEGDGFNLIASDAVPIIKYTDKLIELNDDQLAVVKKDSINIYDMDLDEVSKIYTHKDPELLQKDLNGYPHFMLKEIEEIESVVRKLMLTYYQEGSFTFDEEMIKAIKRADHIIFIACGTSYHASLVGARYFRHVGKEASVYIASEWAFYPVFPGRRPLVIMLSQSGETADLIHCLKTVTENDVRSIVVTNTKGSTLERGCDFSILLNAGLEVSVASTKAYVAQVTALALLTNTLQNRRKIVKDLDKCCQIISYIRNNVKERIEEMANELKDKKDVFFLGRGYDYDFSLEASLKLKEISYIHSEAIAGGELKHGPIALIEKGTPVIVFVTDDVTASSMRGNIQEVKARGADVYVISTKSLSQEGDFIVIEDYDRYLSSVAISSIAFYFAYYVSLFKGLNVDKPRNLAKAVTVE